MECISFPWTNSSQTGMHYMKFISKHLSNSLRPSNAIWRHRFGSILAHVMVCCLMARSQYQNKSCPQKITQIISNKAYLRDLIAATGLVILLELDSNRQFFSPCDLEFRWMTLKNNMTPLLYYAKLYASLQIHRWIQTVVTVRKRSTQQISTF